MLVCLGNLTIDDIVLPDGSERTGCTGGDALYATLAARPFADTDMIAPLGCDLSPELLARLRDIGIRLDRQPKRTIPSLRNRVEYFRDGSRRWTPYFSESEFDLLSPFPEDLPADLLDARAYLVLAMTLSAQERMVRYLRQNTSALIALDPQEDYIQGNEDRLRQLIASVDVFMPSEAEVVQLSGSRDWSAAARTMADLGPEIVVIKLGEDGALIYDRPNDREVRVPAYVGSEVVDTTGAGDSFCGAFVARLLKNSGEPEMLMAAGRAASVAASFAVSQFGADALIEAGDWTILQRLKNWHTV